MKPIHLLGLLTRYGTWPVRHPAACAGLVLALLGSGCERAKEPPPPPPPVVEVAEVLQKDVPIRQEWVGTLDGMVNAQILAQVTGYLIRQNYQEGQAVKKGQLLYEIDPRVFQAALDGAQGTLARQEAVLKTARLDMDRVQRLLPEKAVSVRDRDNAVGREASAQAEVLAAKAAVQKARLDLGFTRIISPIDGVAGMSKAQIGNLVGPGSANEVLTTVSQVDPIKAYIPLSEQQYLQFARGKENGGERQGGLPLELILADGSTYPHPGKFFFADRQVDVKTGTIQMAILFPNPGNLLRPGQYARVRAVVKQKPGALLVPQRAVAEMQGRRLVAVVKSDNTVEIRPVKVAETIDALWIIEEGLKPGERVIVEGVQKVRPGSKVEPKPYAEASAVPAGR
ncbi:efflux RND transporter periplasmic adaptor subunit [Methylococcus sp. EFPC2]|uniref:efflux RND transporter periplasmic adaptor subunit n=1 Tax=Methylococcus sp. EFPC2 TaxID=2812648 RepID=UPI0019687FCC|nr:efflux RND transporter periplasmic adaptor subunit [Methylococcus sp. EFPC2]QSA97814.1 efflux RND transporter periplasmic adaptor subunit [Methylococcus sp. EFPC2]